MTDETVKYLPFNAINEFMRDDYRLSVLHEVFGQLESNPAGKRKDISLFVTRFIKIPGFRNCNAAPAALKAKNSPALFQQSAEFSALVLEAWASLHPELKQAVWNVLSERNWEPAPIEADRSELPGFQIHWPKADTFESFHSALKALMPEMKESEDDISLMVVWVGNRLPYDLFIEETEEK